jgi:hypothetical protein
MVDDINKTSSYWAGYFGKDFSSTSLEEVIEYMSGQIDQIKEKVTKDLNYLSKKIDELERDLKRERDLK